MTTAFFVNIVFVAIAVNVQSKSITLIEVTDLNYKDEDEQFTELQPINDDLLTVKEIIDMPEDVFRIKTNEVDKKHYLVNKIYKALTPKKTKHISHTKYSQRTYDKPTTKSSQNEYTNEMSKFKYLSKRISEILQQKQKSAASTTPTPINNGPTSASLHTKQERYINTPEIVSKINMDIQKVLSSSENVKIGPRFGIMQSEIDDKLKCSLLGGCV